MPNDTTPMGKLKRSYFPFYIDTTMGGQTPNWYRVGKDIESMSMELSPQIETKKNILDEQSVDDKGYETSLSADTYYAEPEDALYPILKGIAMDRKTGGQCKTKFLEFIMDQASGPFDAWEEDCIIKVDSYGDDTAGIKMPFTVTPCGNRKKGTVSLSGFVPTFTPTV